MDKAPHKILLTFTLIATVLAFCVILLGAYTRLKDAGLGCPDWPTCYGHLIVPSQSIVTQESTYTHVVVEPQKAWAEMIHRYMAGSLGILIFVITIFAFRYYRIPGPYLYIPMLMIAVLVFQALLGMWTVTWLLYPLVVMGHLLGGMTLLSLLGLYALYQIFSFKPHVNLSRGFRLMTTVGLIILVLQIMLGGWTSSNYAAIVCPDFPTCHGVWLPQLDFKQAFITPLWFGPNFQGGVLDSIGRITIQMMHRLGALITFVYLASLAFWCILKIPNKIIGSLGLVMLVILLLQVMLGVLNVFLQLPLPIAVAHNGVAALLLLTLVTLNYSVYSAISHDQSQHHHV